MYLFAALELPKEIYLLLNLLLPSNFTRGERHKFNDYMVNIKHSNPLQELIHSKVCLFKKYILGTIWIHKDEKRKHLIKDHKPSSSNLPNEIYHTKRGIAAKLPSREYWYVKEVKKKRESNSSHTPSIFAGINMLAGLTIKTTNSWLAYKGSKKLHMPWKHSIKW